MKLKESDYSRNYRRFSTTKRKIKKNLIILFVFMSYYDKICTKNTCLCIKISGYMP